MWTIGEVKSIGKAAFNNQKKLTEGFQPGGGEG